MRILLTAFEPFGGETVNPGLEAIKLLPGTIEGVEIIKLTVPTVFGKAAEAAAEAMRSLKPQAVVCVGQAGGRKAITPERVAINMEDADIPDNEGNQPCDRSIVPGGPAAYFATLPIKAMVQAVKEAGLPSAVSNTAGTFVCNHLLYSVLHLIGKEMPGTLGGFIHVPYLSEQVSKKPEPAFGMDLEAIVRGLHVALSAVAKSLSDR